MRSVLSFGLPFSYCETIDLEVGQREGAWYVISLPGPNDREFPLCLSCPPQLVCVNREHTSNAREKILKCLGGFSVAKLESSVHK